jgi:ParB/RepB/Spo0J family partition protein
MADQMTPVFVWVDPADLRPNPWNPNEMDPEQYAKALVSIERFGFVDPITVRTNDGYEIIDGENRWRAARDRSLAMVPVTDLGEVPDSVAQQLTVVLNELRGQPNPLKLGALLKSLMASTKMETLLATLPYSREAIGQLTSLPTIDWSEMRTLSDQPLPNGQVKGWVERTYRMPADAAKTIDLAIAQWRRDDPKTPEWRVLEQLAAGYLE